MLNKASLNNLRLHIFSFLLICLTACSSTAVTPTTASKPTTTLTASGSGGTTPILAALAADFAADTPGYKLETLQGTGTSGGVAGIIEGVLDIAAMGRAPSEEEAEQIEFLSLGYGAEVPFVHSDVNISELDSEQLQAIFAGEITNWAEVGGNDQPIIVFARAEDTPHTEVLRQAFFDDTIFTESVQVMGGMGDIIVAVENTPGAIGYVNWATAVALGANVQPLTIDGLSPTDNDYPATLEIGIGYMPEHMADVQPLLDWIESEAGQDKLIEFGVLVTK